MANIIGLMTQELFRIFEIVNREKFNNELPLPVITIQHKKGLITGHFTTAKNWRNKNNVIDDKFEVDENDTAAQYEINLDPRWFYEHDVFEVVETLIHECCHYWNKIHNIEDGNHNKKFKTIAERVGLICERGQGRGYGFTSLSDELRDWIDEIVKPDQEVFNYYFVGTKKEDKPREKKTFKYTCPCCGLEVKGKKNIEVKCAECNELMEMEDEND